MKKRCMALFCFIVLLSSAHLGTFAYAQTCETHQQVISQETTEPYKDVIYYVHAYIDDLRVHRLWNATQGHYIGLWELCDC